MSDLPEGLDALRRRVLASAFLDEPFEVAADAPPDQEALRVQQYAAAQAFHIRRALERIAGAMTKSE